MNCNCKYGVHESGARYRLTRCKKHASSHPVQNVFVRKHYEHMGTLEPDTEHVNEFIENFGPLRPGKTLLEVGAGVSPYAQMVVDAGFSYHGTDWSPFACETMERRGFAMTCGLFDDIKPDKFDAIISAHFLEHVNAPQALAKMAAMLNPGGLLYLLIPDDSDLHNQDHIWFFSEQSAIRLLESTGFKVESSAVKQIVAKEKFMYFVARVG